MSGAGSCDRVGREKAEHEIVSITLIFKIGHYRPVRYLFTNPFSASTFRKSSPGSSIGVSAMNAACFNR
jgi:hypothetical protein